MTSTEAEARPQTAGTGTLVLLVGKFVAWVGASLGSITALLTALGYLVEAGYLSSFGLRRGMLELSANEYLASGGQFMLGLAPLAFVGSLNFALDYWWLALAAAVAFAAGAWRRLRASYRWLVASVVNLAWLSVAIPRIEAVAPGSEASRLLAMMTFVTLASLVYAVAEHAFVRQPAVRARGLLAAQLFFYALLSVTLLTLPYLRGTKGLARELPRVQLLPKDAMAVCELAAAAGKPDREACASQVWRVVQFGKSRSVLLSTLDGDLYVVPVAMTETLRIKRTQEAK